MTQDDTSLDILLLLAVMLPPSALESLGPVVDERIVETQFGAVGPLALRRRPRQPGVWVQPYSGLPTRTDPRAALLAAQTLGVRRVIGWDEVVAVNPLLMRGQPALVSDYIDFTRHQPQSFLESEGFGAIGQSPPVCPQMSQALAEALPAAPAVVYLGIDGPRRETVAEARLFRSWGVDLLGQNLVPEIALAGELELCFSAVVTVRDFAADRPRRRRQGDVRGGLEAVVGALPTVLSKLATAPTCECGRRRGRSTLA